jgi:hypothetical protein
MHSTAMGPPPARMEPQTFGAYAPGTSLPSDSMLAAPYSQGYAQHAWSTGAPAYSGPFGVADRDDWEGGSATWSELVGGGAEPDIIGPSQTYDVSGAPSQDDPFTPAPPPPRPHRAPDAFTYSEDHICRRARTRGGGPRECEVRNRWGRYSSFGGLFIFKLFLYYTIFFLIG